MLCHTYLLQVRYETELTKYVCHSKFLNADILHCSSNILNTFLLPLKGVYWPGFNTMWGRWAPPVERSLLMTMSFVGGTFGKMFSQPLSGVICSSDRFGGWPSVFYVFGWCKTILHLVV